MRAVVLLSVSLALCCAHSTVAKASFKDYTTCEACTAAGYGWSEERARCGGFSNKICKGVAKEACPVSDPTVFDPNGYAMFCLCHGRFGNKMEHLLGGLRWVHEINRTLVLPSFDFMTGRTSTFFPFSDLFDPAVLSKYVKVISIDDFMANFGDKWLASGPKAYTSLGYGDWGMMEKEPMGTMWRGIMTKNTPSGKGKVKDFVELVRPKPGGYLGWDMSEQDTTSWKSSFPGDEHPFLAMRETPGKFPALTSNYELAKHLRWSKSFLRPVEAFFKLHGIGASGSTGKGRAPYVAIHLRNGDDWKIACDRHVVGTEYQATGGFFGSLQCMEEGAKIPPTLCWPTDNIVTSMAKEAVDKVGAKVLFVASDQRHMLAELDAAINAGRSKKNRVKVLKFSLERIAKKDRPKTNDFLPQVDAAILARASITIVNCVSTFSGTVGRERAALGSGPTWFWASDKRS